MHEPSENTATSVPGAFKPLSMGTKIRLTAILILVTLPAVWLIMESFTSNVTGTPRLLFLTLAALLLLFPVRVGQMSIRRRVKTGRWSLWPSDAERAVHFAKLQNRTPQQARRMSTLSELVYGAFWLLDGYILINCFTELWKYLRPNHVPLDGMGRLGVSLWMLLLALELFLIYYKTRKRPATN